MFCNEPIVNVYTGESDILIPKTGKYDGISNSFLDCYHDMAYHVEPGSSLVLETKSYAIFIDFDGVHILNAPAKPRNKREWLNACVVKEPDWVYLEQTLFEGECIQSVEKADNGYIVHFTDFDLKVIPETKCIRLTRSNYGVGYNYVFGCNRYLQRKCSCGGEGEILTDFVSDFLVRCKKCKKSTWAGMCLIDAIKDWNAGELHCDLSGVAIE